MRPKRRLIPVVGVVLILCIVGLSSLLRHRNDRRWLEASGTVEATEARLGFPTSGRVAAVAAAEGEAVAEGGEIARLEAGEVRARLAQAEARVEQAQAMLEELQRGSRSEEIAQARAVRDAAQERLRDAGRDLERARSLHEEGAVSRETLDKAEMGREVARSQAEQAAEQLRMVETGPRTERLAGARAQLAEAIAAADAIRASLDDRAIRSPFAGIVTRRHAEPGEIVSPGATVVTLMNPADRWVRIYIPEPRVGAVHLGQKVGISTDTFPKKSYSGEVVFIASEAEFTPKTVQTKEERVKLVYAAKVRIDGDPAGELKPGMPADVRIELAGRP